MTTLYAFTGFKHVGKSTAAKYLESKGYTRHNFKDAIVQEIKANFPDLLKALAIHYNLTIDELFEQKPPLVRALMVNYGSDFRRKENPRYWVGQWEQALCPELNTVVDDVRFLNEAEAVKREGGIIIRLTRPDLLTGGDHISETKQLHIVADYTVEVEKGDLIGLYQQLDAIIGDAKTNP